MDRGAWRATVHGVTKSWTRLTMHTSPNDLNVFSHSPLITALKLNVFGLRVVIQCRITGCWQSSDSNPGCYNLDEDSNSRLKMEGDRCSRRIGGSAVLPRLSGGQGWQLRRAGACMMPQGLTQVSCTEEGGSFQEACRSMPPGAPLETASGSPRLDRRVYGGEWPEVAQKERLRTCKSHGWLSSELCSKSSNIAWRMKQAEIIY